jgi:hypothetical protein
MSFKLTLYCSVRILRGNNWITCDIMDLINSDIEMCIFYLKSVPDFVFKQKTYLGTGVDIEYDEKNTEIVVNKEDNCFELSMLLNDDADVVDPLIQNYVSLLVEDPQVNDDRIRSYVSLIRYMDSDYALNEIVWNWE